MFNKIFTNIIKSKTTISFLVGFFIVISYQFLIFPGLTVANTILNIISAVAMLFSLMFLFYYVRFMYFNDESFELFTPDPNKTLKRNWIIIQRKLPKKKENLKQQLKLKNKLNKLWNHFLND